MAGITRQGIARFWSAFTIASIVVLMLATTASAGSAVAHTVSAGGADACIAIGLKPGCDANYSLSAIQYANGSMTGQYTDRFANGDGFHAVIGCVSVVGNEAWVSGVITHGTSNGFDLAGLPVSTRVRDNGPSGDEISFSFIGGDATACTTHTAYDLLPTTGQVVVR